MIRKLLWALEQWFNPQCTKYLYIPSPPAMFPIAAIVPVPVEYEAEMWKEELTA